MATKFSRRKREFWIWICVGNFKGRTDLIIRDEVQIFGKGIGIFQEGQKVSMDGGNFRGLPLFLVLQSLKYNLRVLTECFDRVRFIVVHKVVSCTGVRCRSDYWFPRLEGLIELAPL